MNNNFSFPALAAKNKTIQLADYADRVILVVNTASKCGFTKQYEALQKLYERYKDKGLVVLGVPCNDFGKQEPEDEESIKDFCDQRFHVTFPMTSKVKVRGKEAHPFYQWAAAQAGTGNRPKWNFHKYLIGKNGRSLASFPSAVAPEDAVLIEAIEKALK